jgi:hypothetical protein
MRGVARAFAVRQALGVALGDRREPEFAISVLASTPDSQARTC